MFPEKTLIGPFQTAASVLAHRLPHSAKPPSRILPQRGIKKSRHPVRTVEVFVQGYPEIAGTGAQVIVGEVTVGPRQNIAKVR